MRMKLLAAAAIVTAVASPTMAMGPHARSEAAHHRMQESRTYYRHHGFGPAGVAAGVVGGAIGTAGAIAGAPFGYDPYDSYYEGPYPYGE